MAEILARHHIDPPPSPAVLSARLFDRVWTALGCARAPSPSFAAAERPHLLKALTLDDVGFVARAAADCGVGAPPPERSLELMLNALAQAYDPHSRYLAPSALEQFQSQARTGDRTAPRARGELIEHAGHRLAVITLPAIYLRAGASASADLRELLADLATRGGELLVLDLRGNGGGVVREAARVFAVLAGPGQLAWMRRRGQASEALSAPPEPLTWSRPIVVRVDANTASVAELLAAALQDSGRALIVGQRTHGKGTGQTLIPLASPLDAREGAVDVTDRRFYRVDGRSMQRAGVEPDIVLPGPDLPSERTRPGALAADQLTLQGTARPAVRTDAESEGVRAALSYLTGR